MNSLRAIEIGEPECAIPEHRLLWAILQITIRDIFEAPKTSASDCGRNRGSMRAGEHRILSRENQYRRFRDRQAAIQFLSARYDSPPPPFSFQWICEELSDGDVEYLMASVKQLAQLDS